MTCTYESIWIDKKIIILLSVSYITNIMPTTSAIVILNSYPNRWHRQKFITDFKWQAINITLPTVLFGDKNRNAYVLLSVFFKEISLILQNLTLRCVLSSLASAEFSGILAYVLPTSHGLVAWMYYSRKWQDYVYIQCEYKSTKQKIKHLLREENKVKENKIS